MGLERIAMIKEISATLVLTRKAGNLVAAVADVSLDLGEAGTIKVCGFRVMRPDGKPVWVAAPARHGEKAWFDTVRLYGPLKKAVETVVLREYERATQAASRK
jgi:DNA-binding cell septation regulator SpoVG